MKPANSDSREIRTFWEQLDQDIDRIGNRAKQKLHHYEKKQQNTARHNPQSKPVVKLNFKKKERSKSVTSDDLYNNLSVIDRRELEKLQKAESERQQIMKNRLTYIHHDKKRQNKTIELARKKFEQVVTIRAQNFKQKQALKKKIASLQKEDKQQKTSMVQIVQTAREIKNTTIKDWRKTMYDNAREIRNMSINNDSLAALEKARSKQINSQRANQTKKNLEKSRSIVSEMRERRAINSRNERQQQLASRLRFLDEQKVHSQHIQRVNEEILNKLKKETDKVTKWQSRAQKEIQSYRSYLGQTLKSPTNSALTDKKSARSTKSFYLTHFDY